MQIVRQGDVLVVPVESVPATAIKAKAENGRLILARGEATGHHHSLALSRRITMFRDDASGGTLYVTVKEKPAQLEHQEHSALTIQPGNYEIRIQRGYSGEGVSRVQD